MRLSEIKRTQNVVKDDEKPKEWDSHIGNAKPTGKEIGGYKIYADVGINKFVPIQFLIKDPNDEGFLGELELEPFGGMFKSQVGFSKDLQGQKLAVPLYVYVIKELGYTLVSDFEQSPGGEYIWKQLAERPDVNVYIYNHSDRTFHGEYDPRDSGSVYGPEEWRDKILLVATADTVTSVNEAWSEKYKKSINCSNPKGFSQKAHCAGRKKKVNERIYIPPTDDNFFKHNRFKRTEYAGMKLVYGEANQLFQIYAYSAYDQAMGAVMFGYDPEYDAYIADYVFVEKRFRRKGVATALYDFAKEKLDAPIKPSTVLEPDGAAFWGNKEVWEAELEEIIENFHDGKKKGKSKPGRVKKAGASCKGSVSHLRQMAKKYSGERGKMYHWCANMKGGKKKKK